MNGELLRLVDSIHRDKGIDTEAIFKGIEDALVLTAQKHLNTEEKIVVTIDRATGKITAQDETGKGIPAAVLGRIAAQSAKGFLLQNIKDAEGDVVYGNFESKIRTIISGTVLRIDRGDIFVLVNKIEALLPKEEQVPGESYHIGEHIKALILKVKKDGGQVRIILSRSHPDFVARLFETEVPEIADKTIQIKDVVREAGFRTKLAVYSANPKVDPVGACVGVRGNRIKNVVEELASEKIDIIKWDEKPEVFIPNSMKPAEVQAIEIDPENKRAKIYVMPEQISLAIGKKGQNIRLASRLTHWEIDVVSSEELMDKEKETEKPQAAGTDEARKG